MQSLAGLPEEKGKIFRIKAILSVKGHPFKHVFHAVMDVSDEDDAGPWQELPSYRQSATYWKAQ